MADQTREPTAAPTDIDDIGATAEAAETTVHAPTVVGEVIEVAADQVGQHPDNIRDPRRDIDALAESIRQVGVLVPLLVVPVAQISADGDDVTYPDAVRWVAVDGNRRQLAAAQAGKSLPCIVHPNLAAARDAAVAMATTGLARDGLTVVEQARAVQTLLDLGLTQTVVAKATGVCAKTVRAAKKAATLTDDQLDETAKYDLTLDQLAVIAELGTDDDSYRRLVSAARDGRLAHAAQGIRSDRAKQAEADKLATEYVAMGYAILDNTVDHWQVPNLLKNLADPGSDQRIANDDHQTCPGRAVYLWVDGWQPTVQVLHGCVDPKAHGHVYRVFTDQPAGRIPRDKMTDDRKAEAADERRELIRRNKEMLAAQTVRRQFVRQMLSTRKQHRRMVAWAMLRITQRDRTFARWLSSSDDRVLQEILGAQPCKLLNEAPGHQHPALVWAELCAAYESELPKDEWRRPPESRTSTDDYLAHLVDLGYAPCETEQQMLDTRAPRRRLGEGWAFTRPFDAEDGPIEPIGKGTSAVDADLDASETAS